MSDRPTSETAMAEALHETDDFCNANYYLPFEECATQEFDLERAAEVLEKLRAKGWRLVTGDDVSLSWLHEALNSGDGTYRP